MLSKTCKTRFDSHKEDEGNHRLWADCPHFSKDYVSQVFYSVQLRAYLLCIEDDIVKDNIIGSSRLDFADLYFPIGLVPKFVVIDRLVILTPSNQTSVVLVAPLITAWNSSECQPLVTEVVLVVVADAELVKPS